MIRVNLLRDVTGGAFAPTSVGTAVDSGGTSASAEGAIAGNADIVIKVILFVIPVALVYFTRSYIISARQTELRSLTTHQKQLEDKLKSFEPGLRDIEKFQEEKKKLDSQLDVIRKLSKERLKNVKSLDALQGIIPKQAWLSRLKITADKMEIEGFAIDDIVIADFMKSLGSSIYFGNVSLQSSEDAKLEEGPAKKFVIKCSLENL